MTLRFLKTATLLALAACSTLALADDPPSRVGRVALTQGQVQISGAGAATQAALVNWPVTSNQTISTAPGARTELRIGSTAIRLDGDTALEVLALDEDKLRLRLHHGSASIRVVNHEVADGFELGTPQARVLLQGPGRLRVHAERGRDSSSVRVFEGVASVEGGGERLTVRSGRSAEMQGSDLRMTQAVGDAFDAWAAARDREVDVARATRYVPAEMTGVEDLDRHGSWRDDSEYGALWLPSVASNWVPYRDGRWTWIAPWGWTWVDNAPWGYAPFHYGRWVHVGNRWAWAPGRLDSRPVWAPALVGWVGGTGWNVHAGSGSALAQGWYPLSPHDHFVPGYRLSDKHLRRLNNHDGWRHRDHAHDYRQRGLTVVPQDHFGQRGEVVVRHEGRVTPPANWQQAPLAQPPVPRSWRERAHDDGHRERRGNDGHGWRRDGHDGHAAAEDGWRQRAARQREAVVVTPPAPQVFTPRGGVGGAIEAAAMRAQAQAQMQAQAQAQMQAQARAQAQAQMQAQAQRQDQALTAVAPPAPRAAPAALDPPPSRRVERQRQGDGDRHIER